LKLAIDHYVANRFSPCESACKSLIERFPDSQASREAKQLLKMLPE
jgi:hypothetical protein